MVTTMATSKMHACVFMSFLEVVIVEKESNQISSGSTDQGEIQRVKTATFYQWRYSH